MEESFNNGNPGRVIIRKAEPRDIPALTALSAELGYETTEAEVARRFARLSEKESHYLYVAALPEVVGFISFEPYQGIYFDEGLNITGLVVTREFRNRGIGKMLVAAAEAIAREGGYAFLRANSSSHRTGAHEFYRNQGFDSEKEQKRFLKWVKKGNRGDFFQSRRG